MNSCVQTITRQKGYVAMISAMLISFLLIATVLGVGISGFFLGSNTLDAEFKEQSLARARGCIEYARLQIAAGNYPSNEIISLNGSSEESCTIIESKNNFPIPEQTFIATEAVVHHSYTSLRSVIDSNTFSIISLEECTSPDYC